jgi:hypothetical protein
MKNDFFVSIDRNVIAFAIVTGSVLVVSQLVRLRRAALLYRTISRAIDANSPLAPALIEKLSEKPSHADDSRSGLILMALAIGVILFGLVQGGTGDVRSFVAIAMVPFAVGAALFGRGRLGLRKGADR